MNLKIISVLVVLAVAMAFSAACTGTGDSGSATPTESGESTGSVTPTVSADMIPGPTSQPSSLYQVAVQVSPNPINGNITVTFNGGAGKGQIYEQVVDVYYPDGTQLSKSLGNAIGDEVEFPGSTTEQQRVQVTVTFNGNVGTYVIYDALVPTKT